jgi:ATP phosphoribosyltransferase
MPPPSAAVRDCASPPSTSPSPASTFAAKGVHVDLIKLYGSMELAPLAGLAEAIVDLVSSGATLKANRLVEVEEIMSISSRLVVNQAALKMKRDLLQPVIAAIEGAIK